MLDILHRLEATGVGTLVRESLYGFQILVAIHVMGLVLSVGMILWFDLRLTGLALGSAPVSRVYRRLIPWATTGFVVMFSSRPLLFTGFARAAYPSPYFRIKISALLLRRQMPPSITWSRSAGDARGMTTRRLQRPRGLPGWYPWRCGRQSSCAGA